MMKLLSKYRKKDDKNGELFPLDEIHTKTKRCSHCKQVQPIENFGKKRSTKDGLNPWCKECTREYSKRYQTKIQDEQIIKSISHSITNGKVDDIFDVSKLDDIPRDIRNKLQIPKYILKPNSVRDKHFVLRANLMNVLRRLGGREVHISQITVAFYRMHHQILTNRELSIQLMYIKRRDKNLIQTRKGYYKYITENNDETIELY